MKWLHWNLPLVAIALVWPASARSVDPNIRQAVEGVAATFAEHYNKQDAAAVAGTFTKDRGVSLTVRLKERSGPARRHWPNAMKVSSNSALPI